MLRLTDIKLPLDHNDSALAQTVIETLSIDEAQLLNINVFKRGYDARNNNNIQLIYTLDVEVQNEAALLSRFANNPQVRVTPDMTYKFVAKAPDTPNPSLYLTKL